MRDFSFPSFSPEPQYAARSMRAIAAYNRDVVGAVPYGESVAASVRQRKDSAPPHKII